MASILSLSSLYISIRLIYSLPVAPKIHPPERYLEQHHCSASTLPSARDAAAVYTGIISVFESRNKKHQSTSRKANFRCFCAKFFRWLSGWRLRHQAHVPQHGPEVGRITPFGTGPITGTKFLCSLSWLLEAHERSWRLSSNGRAVAVKLAISGVFS